MLSKQLFTTMAFLAATISPMVAVGPANADVASIELTGGRVHTPGGVVAALAVSSDGVILAVGSADEVSVYRGEDTKVIDLSGRTVLPGFHDLHVHPAWAGIRAAECVIPQGSDLETLRAIVSDCVARAKPGEWVTGGQWDASAIGGVPTREMLDDISPDNPIVLLATSGHSAWANSRAFDIAGVTDKTVDPEGGIIERRGDGEPAGVLREYAMGLVRSHVPPPSADQVRDGLAWSLNKMLANGITSFTAASVLPEAAVAYAELADAGVLKQRARLCLRWYDDNPEAVGTIRSRNHFSRERVRTDCVKVMLDGVPTDSHTAAMLKPYAGQRDGNATEASEKGLLMVAQESLNALTAQYDAQGLTVKFHAAGDAAVRAGLNAIEAARQENGPNGPLHDIAHCTFVSEDDIQRARDIAATFEVSPYLWAPSPINDSIAAAIGDARMERVWPVRDMLEAGALVVPGSDWSVVPSVNPWIGIETLITRRTPGEIDGDAFGGGQAIDLASALAMYTTSAARHTQVAHKLGRIEAGMLADLVIVDQDPYQVPVTDLHKTKVTMTIIAGEVVFVLEES